MMIDVRQLDTEPNVPTLEYLQYELEGKLFRTSNYDCIITSFYSHFYLKDDTKINVLNHFIKANDKIYCFIEEIDLSKHDDILWFSYDNTQKVHLMAIFELHNEKYTLTKYVSNIKEPTDELTLTKLINVFGDHNYLLKNSEYRISPWSIDIHFIIFKKFNISLPKFDFYNDLTEVFLSVDEREDLIKDLSKKL